MGMVKLITPGSYDFGEPVTQLVKIARNGLQGADLRRFTKRASAALADKVASIHTDPGEVLIHLIALGDTEKFGSNRNGDGFRRAICREYHPTFQKYARFYRHHNNKDTAKGYGVIKLSHYNEPMGRVELLVALNGTKEAADRNKGLIADEEIEKLAADKEIPVSMACRVSHDICSGCGNKARGRAEYCGPELCKYGGLRDNIGKIFEDGHVLHADNPDPKFFDISAVYRPADRIAYVLGKAAEYTELMKAANARIPLSGAEAAEQAGVTCPLWLFDDGPWSDRYVVGQMKVAEELIARENEPNIRTPHAIDRAFIVEVQMPTADTSGMRKQAKLGHIMQGLANANCLLPVHDFLILLSGQDPEKTANAAALVANRLPGIHNRLAAEPDFERALRENPYLPTGAPSNRVRDWVAKHAHAWSLDRDRLIERMQLSLLRHPAPPQPRTLVKVANDAKVDALAREYALYQLAFLQTRAESSETALTFEAVIRHNYIK